VLGERDDRDVADVPLGVDDGPPDLDVDPWCHAAKDREGLPIVAWRARS
jgi:hypothetical protein